MESKQKRNLVKEADLQKNSAADEDHFTDGSSTHRSGTPGEVVEQDKHNSMSVYCSWRFLLGLLAMITCLTAHVYLIKYLDLTLIAANSANSIVAAIIFSTWILGEKVTLIGDSPHCVFPTTADQVVQIGTLTILIL